MTKNHILIFEYYSIALISFLGFKYQRMDMKKKRKVIIEKYWVIGIFIKDFLLLAFYKFKVIKYYEERVQKNIFFKI